MEQKYETPKSTLLGFFKEMHSWGLDVIQADKSIDIEKTTQEELDAETFQQKEALSIIYNKYCERGLKAKRLQDEGLSFNSKEPEYNEKHPILETNKLPNGNVQFIVEGKTFLFLYELSKKDDRWWVLDNRQYSSKKTQKWRNRIL